VPFVHFFDGFRTSHEINKVEPLDVGALGALVDRAALERHRQRALNPCHPTQRGTSQGPDVYFQARIPTSACARTDRQTDGADDGRSPLPCSASRWKPCQSICIVLFEKISFCFCVSSTSLGSLWSGLGNAVRQGGRAFQTECFELL
jgi:Pyruvate flavodoxin/ferredoxin oxidoreductase, thiamine diP-bdg